MSIDCNVLECGKIPHIQRLDNFKFNEEEMFSRKIEILWTKENSIFSPWQQEVIKKMNLDEPKEYIKFKDLVLICRDCGNNPKLRNIFAIHFSGKELKDKGIRDYKKEVNLLYRNVAKRHGFIEYGANIDFSNIHALAQRYIKWGNFLKATEIYQALAK